ncbi:MAG: hypothetical protein FWH29_05225 [Methanobrevibacter sp.]|nr:hypothetical protein [Methanobrevibacter sp.]
MKLNKNVLIAILLLTVFAIGTLNLLDTVEAAKWKKFDSGSYNNEYPEDGFKKKMSFVSYKKGSEYIKTKIYGYKIKNNKKVLLVTVNMIKINNTVKSYSVVDGKKSKVTTHKTTLKQLYKEEIYAFKNGRRASYYYDCC